MYRIFRCAFVNTLSNKPLSNYHFSSAIIYRDFSDTSQVKPAYQAVADYYAGKSVFLTGATGFIGRLMIERLLHNCKDIDNIYILIRPKKNANLQQRLQELLQNPIFKNLKETRPQDLNKIVPIAGDIADVRLRINLEDEQTLIEKVSVIFHSAANVKFRAPLSDHLKVNYEGTKNVLDLGKKMNNLDVFLYVSTTFHNSEDPVVDEIVYPPPRNIEDAYKAISNHGDESVEVRQMLDKWQNGYIFSKKMAEAYVASNHGSIRTIIVRPSMVTSVYKQPLEGYTDSWVAGTGLLCDIASGLARVVYGKKDVVVEIIPADYVCNFLIAAAAKNFEAKECNVYNMSSGHSNPIDWGKLTDIYIKEGKKHGYVVAPFPTVYFTKASWAIPILRFLTQIVPAFVTDTWLRFTGRQPRYMKLQKTVISRTIFSIAVTGLNWDIKTTRARELFSMLDSRDQEIFPCDPATIDWNKYVPIYCKGVKKYMLENKNQ